jgi:hypothetical protein
MIICGFKEQIELLSKLQSFEVDMSFKRLYSKNMNEVLFATFLPDQCKSKHLLTGYKALANCLSKLLLYSESLLLKILVRVIIYFSNGSLTL